MDEITMRLATSLTEVVTRNTIEQISTKINLIKEKKKAEEQQAAYEEIINALLQDKMELERLSREYKDLYEKVTISDEDIEHLQNTVHQVIQQFSFNLNEQQKELLLQLISRDTLKTMQLLGFNFKEAIGQPLTDVCSNAIKRNIAGDDKSKQKKK